MNGHKRGNDVEPSLTAARQGAGPARRQEDKEGQNWQNMADADVERRCDGGGEIDRRRHNQEKQLPRGGESAREKCRGGNQEQSHHAQRQLDGQHHGKVVPDAVRKDLSQDEGRAPIAHIDYVAEAEKVAFRQQAVMSKKENALRDKRLESMSGAFHIRIQMQAGGACGVTKSIKRPENQNGEN